MVFKVPLRGFCVQPRLSGGFCSSLLLKLHTFYQQQTPLFLRSWLLLSHFFRTRAKCQQRSPPGAPGEDQTGAAGGSRC